MSDTNNQNFPNDIYTISTAVARSLEELDQIFFLRLNATSNIAASMMNTTIELVAKANELSECGDNENNLEALKQKAELAQQNAQTANENAKKSAEQQLNTLVSGKQSKSAESALETAAAQALSNAYHNAVTSQEQLNITAQTIIVQGVSTLFSLVTAATGVSESEHFAQLKANKPKATTTSSAGKKKATTKKR